MYRSSESDSVLGRGFGQGSLCSLVLPFIDIFLGPVESRIGVVAVVVLVHCRLRKSARNVYREPARLLSPTPRELIYPRDTHLPQSNSRAIVYLFADLIEKNVRVRECRRCLFVAFSFVNSRLTMTWNVEAYFLL